MRKKKNQSTQTFDGLTAVFALARWQLCGLHGRQMNTRLPDVLYFYCDYTKFSPTSSVVVDWCFFGCCSDVCVWWRRIACHLTLILEYLFLFSDNIFFFCIWCAIAIQCDNFCVWVFICAAWWFSIRLHNINNKKKINVTAYWPFVVGCDVCWCCAVATHHTVNQSNWLRIARWLSFATKLERSSNVVLFFISRVNHEHFGSIN